MKPDQLLNLFTSHFNMTELEGLCFDLGVNHEEIPGHNQTISEFARNIILYFARNERLPALIECCRELRPEASWPDDDSLPDFSAWHEAEIGEKELENYLAWVQTQYNTMRVLSMTQPLSLQTVYTDVFLLDKSEYWQEQGIDKLEKAFAGREGLRQGGKRIQGGELLAQANRFFIMGQPGVGKTTFSKWLALQAAQSYVEEQRIPVYLALRRFNTWDNDLLALLAHELELGGIAASIEKMKGLLQERKLLILLDGLDEVLAEQRDSLNDQIFDLAKWCDENQIIITCRPHAETRWFERFEYVQIADFTEEQVEHFVRHWFDDSKLADSLLSDLRKSEHKSIRELAHTPLLLVLLCIGYGYEPSFPKRKDQLYERALQVVLQQWDEERGVKRESNYGQLSLKKKQDLLVRVAYVTFLQEQLFIAEADLAQHIDDFWQNWRQEEIKRQIEEYGQVYPPELPPRRIVPRKIIQEIVAQHGLFVEQLAGIYSFSHMTLQEYFVACFIVANENQGSVKHLMTLVNDDRWREIFLLTAGMLVDATEFFEQFLQTLNLMVTNDSQLVACLNWADEKSTRIQLPYKLAARRAFLFYSARDFSLTHNLDFAHVVDLSRALELDPIRTRALLRKRGRERDLARARARDLASARDLACALDPDLARVLALDYDLDLAREFDRSLTRNLSLMRVLAHAHIRAFQAAKRLELREMLADLQVLVVPQKTDSLKIWQVYCKHLVDILEYYRDGWDPFQKVQPEDKEIYMFKNLSTEQVDKLTRYFDANLLLVYCLEVAQFPNHRTVET